MPDGGLGTQTAEGALRIRVETGAADVAEPGLRIPADTSFEIWRSIGLRLGKQMKVTPWRAADWHWFGEGRFGPEKVAQVVAEAGFDEDEIHAWALTAGRFTLQRRNPRLTIQHHAQLAFWGSDTDQDEFLQKAEANGWSQRQMKAAIREHEQALSEEGTRAIDLAVAQGSPAPPSSESADLQRLLDGMRLSIDLDVVRAVQAHGELEGVDPLEWWQKQMRQVVQSAPVAA